jgi:hypothetical protein
MNRVARRGAGLEELNAVWEVLPKRTMEVLDE